MEGSSVRYKLEGGHSNNIPGKFSSLVSKKIFI
jgi:hypothetical protein